MKTTTKRGSGFSDEEREAMQTRVKELQEESRVNKNKAEGEKAVLAAIAKLPVSDRTMAKRLHTIITAATPTLWPKTWYGMPAYAKDGDVVCFFQSAHRFKSRYATFGFSDKAKLDDGNLWPAGFALMKLTPVEEKKIAALVKKAVG